MAHNSETTRVLRYTTAPEVYDGFGSNTVQTDAGEDHRGMPVRLVSIEAKHLDWQETRYGSGLHGSANPEEAARWPSIWKVK